MTSVSGNPRGTWGILLRAVSVSLIQAPQMLYVAAELLRRGRNKEDRAYNQGVMDLATVLIGLPGLDYEVIEHALRNLPANTD